jgi:hypothetical protein
MIHGHRPKPLAHFGIPVFQFAGASSQIPRQPAPPTRGRVSPRLDSRLGETGPHGRYAFRYGSKRVSAPLRSIPVSAYADGSALAC